MPFQPLDESPGRDSICEKVKGLLLKAYPAKELDTHFRTGYRFRSEPCTTTFAYDPEFCVPGAVKMDPEGFGPEKDAVVGMVQSAFHCSTVGDTLEVLRQHAIDTIDNNLWRAIENDLVVELASQSTDQTPAPLEAHCVLAEAAQFLAISSNCGRGVIVGPYDWFIQLNNDYLTDHGTHYTDAVGNIIIPLSVDNNTVYAFDSNIDIRVTDILVMDERAPGITTINDRVVRAEQIYTVAVDPCVVGAFDVSDCCGCASGGGGGGGGGNVTVTNFPANQNTTVTNFPANQTVTVSNFPADSDFDFEELLLCDDNGPFIHRSLYNAETGVFVSATNTTLAGAAYVPVGTVAACGPTPLTPITLNSYHRLVGDVDAAWTPAEVVGTLTSVTYSILSGTANVIDSGGAVAAGLPSGLSGTWEITPDTASLNPPQSIDAVGGSVYVIWTAF